MRCVKCYKPISRAIKLWKICVDCKRAVDRKNRMEYRKLHPEVMRIWNKNNRAKVDAALKKNKELFPDRARARELLKYAVRRGKLVRGCCAICGGTPADGHHQDYSKPLDVIWLCRVHHKKVHAGYLKVEVSPDTETK